MITTRGPVAMIRKGVLLRKEDLVHTPIQNQDLEVDRGRIQGRDRDPPIRGGPDEAADRPELDPVQDQDPGTFFLSILIYK